MKLINCLIIAGILSAMESWSAVHDKYLVRQKTNSGDNVATFLAANPIYKERAQVLFFADTNKFASQKLPARIALYDTPVDTVLVEGGQNLFGQTKGPFPPLPVVEVPSRWANQTVTLFYSGDGGWRDLDRTVAEEMAKLGYPVVGIDTLRGFWSRKTPEQAADELAGTIDYYRNAWAAKTFVLAGYSFGADILPAIYNRLPPADQDSIRLLVLLAVSKQADFEIHILGWFGKDSPGLPITPELARIPENKIVCVYGEEEKTETACSDFANTQAQLLEFPGGHHFDEDYPKLTRLILEKYQAVGIYSGLRL